MHGIFLFFNINILKARRPWKGVVGHMGRWGLGTASNSCGGEEGIEEECCGGRNGFHWKVTPQVGTMNCSF